MRKHTLRTAARSLALLAGCAAMCSCRAQEAQVVERDEWVAVMVGDSKIGFGNFTTARETTGPHIGLARMGIAFTARLADMGIPAEIEISITQWVEPATGRPVRLEAVLPAGPLPTRITVTFGEREVTAVRTAYDGERSETLAIPEGARLQGELAFLARPLTRGEQEFTFYNVMSGRLETGATAVAETDDGWRVDGIFSGGHYTLRLNKAGRIVDGTGILGVRLVAQGEEEARDLGSADYAPPLEFGIGARTSRPLPRPEDIERLTVLVGGLELPDGPPQMAGRQEVVHEADGSYRVTVVADDIRNHTGPELGFAVPADLRELTASDAMITSDDEAVRAAAREAAGETRDASRAAERLCAWVDERLAFGGALDSARTAAEILRSGRGVCRDYAALYCALARALGIPSRMCTGLVYARDGFYLHSWAESWLGEDNGWVPLDPTRSGLPVDATHVTLVIGGVDSVWSIMRIVGQLEIEVLEVGLRERPAAALPLLPW